MKIGLIRHFKVKHSFPKNLFLTKAEVIKWFDEYESAEIQFQDVDFKSIKWQTCYSSSQNRAVKTANYIHKEKVIIVDELKELDILHLLPGKIKLPFIVWAIIIRFKSFSAKGDVGVFRERIIFFINNLIEKENTNVLIVSHWFVMKILENELKKICPKGEKIKSPEYGKIYVFEYSNNR